MWCSSCKNTFLGAGSLQMITNKVWCENTCVLFLVPVLCIFLFLKKLKDILGADYIKKNVNWAGLCKTTNCSLILHNTTLLRLWEGDELFEIKSFTWNISESNQPLKCFLKLFFFKNLLTKSCKSNFYVSVVNCFCTYIFKGSNYSWSSFQNIFQKQLPTWISILWKWARWMQVGPVPCDQKFIIFQGFPTKQAAFSPGQPASYNQLLFQPVLLVLKFCLT